MESMHRQYRITCRTINIIGITKRVKIFKKKCSICDERRTFLPLRYIIIFGTKKVFSIRLKR